jgi:HlyD family secretion protein
MEFPSPEEQAALPFGDVLPAAHHDKLNLPRKMDHPLTMRTARFTFFAALLSCSLTIAGCSDGNGPDAHGNFEANEVTVSSETEGQLLRFDLEEGDRLAAAEFGALGTEGGRQKRERGSRRTVVGLVDTTRLALQRRELRARRKSVRSQMRSISAEVDVLAEQLRAARRELDRMRTLRKGDAAPQRQVDRAENEVRVLEQRIEATRTQKASLNDEIEAINEQIAQVNDRIRESWITNPIAGTVLTTYVEEGEVVRSGEPLYKIASLDTLTLRAYVSGAQLSEVQIGERARILFDDGPASQKARTGRVTWVADEAEFTPTPIQTKEERVDFVYAVKLRVPNPDGTLKIGMPGDVMFGDGAGTSDTDASPDTTVARR